MVPRSVFAVFSTAFALLLLSAADEELLDDPLAESFPEPPQAARAKTPAANSAAQLADFLTVGPPRRAGPVHRPRTTPTTARVGDRFSSGAAFGRQGRGAGWRHDCT